MWGHYTSGMFVRTKTRKSDDHRHTLNFSLVESVRVEGKPRQRFVAGLGSIDVSHPDCRPPAFWLKTPDGSGYVHDRQLAQFWDSTDEQWATPGIVQRLDEYDLTSAERGAIIKGICRSIPAKPTKAQLRVGDADRTCKTSARKQATLPTPFDVALDECSTLLKKGKKLCMAPEHQSSQAATLNVMVQMERALAKLKAGKA